MSKERNVYEELAALLCEEYLRKQSASLLANLEKRNLEALDVSKNKILEDVRIELSKYQDEDGRELTDEEKSLVINLVKKELWGYGIIDDLIHDRGISDIKLYGDNNVRIKRIGKRGSSGITFLKVISDVIYVIASENEVSVDDVSPLMVFDRLEDKSISYKMVLTLMDIYHGTVSIDDMEDADDRLQDNATDVVDKLNLEMDKQTKDALDRFFILSVN